MNIKELRLGNSVNCRVGDKMIVKPVSPTMLNHFDRFIDLKPIPLTEEWLLKFGFEITTDPENIHYKLSLIGEFNESFVVNRKVGFDVFYVPHKDCNDYLCFTTQIKSIHQLQNLFFALVGEELTISE